MSYHKPKNLLFFALSHYASQSTINNQRKYGYKAAVGISFAARLGDAGL